MPRVPPTEPQIHATWAPTSLPVFHGEACLSSEFLGPAVRKTSRQPTPHATLAKARRHLARLAAALGGKPRGSNCVCFPRIWSLDTCSQRLLDYGIPIRSRQPIWAYSFPTSGPGVDRPGRPCPFVEQPCRFPDRRQHRGHRQGHRRGHRRGHHRGGEPWMRAMRDTRNV